MKRYLVIFIDTEGNFCVEAVMADNFVTSLEAFYQTGLEHQEVYSITRAA